MSRADEATLAKTATIADAIAKLNSTGLRICLVVEGDGRLLGTVTDGDVRRGILRLDLGAPVTQIMRRDPRVAAPNEPDGRIRALMLKAGVQQVPVVDADGRLVDLKLLGDFVAQEGTRDHWVVIMAGGLGSRLQPLTLRRPKPMVEVGERPLLETILDNLVAQGFFNFYVSVRYKASIIKEHFADGAHRDVRIRYVEEGEQLGTAGPLRLLPERPDKPIVVMNGDLLTKANCAQLLEYHESMNAKATMCVRRVRISIPFGVVDVEDGRLRRVDEKPLHSFFANAGIYALEPEMIDHIPEGRSFDMPDLFERALEAELPTAAFPLHEYWLDVGRMEDLVQANFDYAEVFRP
jgi:dTDP-glucose pyrophosphorylase